jgi:hypothetical protein
MKMLPLQPSSNRRRHDTFGQYPQRLFSFSRFDLCSQL